NNFSFQDIGCYILRYGIILVAGNQVFGSAKVFDGVRIAKIKKNSFIILLNLSDKVQGIFTDAKFICRITTIIVKAYYYFIIMPFDHFYQGGNSSGIFLIIKIKCVRF